MEAGSKIRIGEFTLDVEGGALWAGSKRKEIAHKPLEVLRYLAGHAGQVVSKQELLQAVWGGQRAENTVEQAVRQIRRALGDDSVEPRYIRTISGEGYCLIAPVSVTRARNGVGGGPGGRARLVRAAGWTVAAAAIAMAAYGVRPQLPAPALENPRRVVDASGTILSPVLSDGKRLYYQGFDGGRWRVEEAPIGGGEPLPVAVGVAQGELCDVAGGRGEMLVRSLRGSRDERAPLYVKPLSGGVAWRAGGMDVYDAAWDTRAGHILVSNGGTIYRMDLASGHRDRICAAEGHVYWMRWSPDGGRLRFTVLNRKTEEAAIWEYDGSGEAHRVFPEMKLQQCCGSWTADGKYFVFQARTDFGYQIWARRERGAWFYAWNREPVALTIGPYSYRSPLPMGNGKLYARTEVERGELLEYEAKRGEFEAVRPAVSARTAAFSADGEWLAYSGLPEPDLWRSRRDGSDRLELTSGFLQTALPAWAPDGRSIAFMGRQRSGTRWSIYIVGRDGGGYKQLPADGANDADPAWSPDGSRLVYSHWLEEAGRMGLYIETLAGASAEKVPGSEGIVEPAWSRDGRRLAGIRLPEGRLEVYEFGSGKWREMGARGAAFPHWSGGGRYLYYSVNRGGEAGIERMRMADGRIEPVTELGKIERGKHFLSEWVGLGPGDAPLVVRDLTKDSIVAWEFREP